MPRKTKSKAALIGVFAMVLSAVPLAAADLKGPAELPPKEYKGQQYVDSKGCVFLRGGYGGQVTWVPRVTRDRKQMCGYPPSGRRVEVAKADETPAAPPAAPPAAKPEVKSDKGFVATAPIAPPLPKALAAPVVQTPKAQIAPAPKVVASPPKAPVVQPNPVRRAPVAAPSYRVVCPAEAPYPKAFALQNGGSQVFCTKDGASLAEASPPLLPDHARPSVPLRQTASAAAPAQVVKSFDAAEHLPAGYVPVWQDDRLNPYRGPRSAAGDAAMAQIWTETIPAKERRDLPKIVYLAPQEVAAHAAPLAPAPKPAGKPSGAGKYRVQIGSFAQSANAERAAGQLAAMGYPVSKAMAKGGRLQVVYAGPFASGGEAQSALAQLRASGYGDAILAR